jgi:hypothetical protein
VQRLGGGLVKERGLGCRSVCEPYLAGSWFHPGMGLGDEALGSILGQGTKEGSGSGLQGGG